MNYLRGENNYCINEDNAEYNYLHIYSLVICCYLVYINFKKV